MVTRTIFPGMKKFKLFIALIVVLAGLGAWYYSTGNFSEGDRAGTVIKLSRKGFLFKTFEGELNLGMGIHDDNANAMSISNVWNFSVAIGDTAVIQALDAAMMNGHRAKLQYREKFVGLPWRGDTHYMVYQVDVIH